MTNNELVERVALALYNADLIHLFQRPVKFLDRSPFCNIARQNASIAVAIVLEEAAKVAEQYNVKNHGHLSTNSAAAAVAAAEIAAAIQPNGGWKKDKLAEWGVSWPPPKGWKKDLERRYAEAHGLPVRRAQIPFHIMKAKQSRGETHG